MPTKKDIRPRRLADIFCPRRCLLAVASGCLVWSWLAMAHAEGAGAKAEAREHFDRGLRLLDAGDLHSAAIEFEAAHKLFPAALAAYDAALAHARLNRPLAAVRLLREAREQNPSIALREKISSLLREQEARLGTLLVHVTDTSGAPIDSAELRAAGYSAGELRVGQAAELSPGSFTLRIVAAGHAPIERTIDVAPGGKQELAVVLERTETHPPTPVEHRPPATQTPPADRHSTAPPLTVEAPARLPIAGIVTAGVGAAILVASAALLWDADRGLVELAPQVDSFNASTSPGAQCSRGNNVSQCRSRSEELNQRRADLNREQIFGFIGLGVGATAAVSGIVWYLSATQPRSVPSGKLPVELVVAPGVASLLVSRSF
jgi:hypothetical protein